MVKRAVCLLVLMMAAVPVTAETYKWVDDKGTLNFAEDLSKVPKKYRKKARIIGDVSISTQETMPGAVEIKKEKEPSAATAGNKELPVKQENKGPMYGGKSADEWSAEFKKINNEIKDVEEKIAAQRDELSQPEKLSRGRYISIEKDIRNQESKLQVLKNRLTALDESASRVGVAFDLRK